MNVHRLAPIVENAVKYGISNNSQPAWITLGASSEGDWLNLEVCDDALDANDKSFRATGIGLANVHERAVGRFGDCRKFEAGRVSPTEFQVQMKLPLGFVP